MNRSITPGLFAAIALTVAAVSCSKDVVPVAGEPASGLSPRLVVTATVEGAAADGPRVTYNVGNSIVPSWTVGDKVIGFDDLGNKFTFTVSSVDGVGKAEMDVGDYIPGSAGVLYAVYAPGKSESDIVDGSISVDLSSQSGVLGKNTPLIMCARGSISLKGGTPTVDLKFHNQTAVVGLKEFKVDPDATITGISLSGVVTKGTICINPAGFSLVPDNITASAGITFSPGVKASPSGIISKASYFVVLPCSSVNMMLYAHSADKKFVNLTDIDCQSIVGGRYYYMTKKMGEGTVEIPELGMTFPSLEKAFSEISRRGGGYTVRLLDDCAEDTLTLVSPSAKTTLDLNGCTLTTSITINGKAEIKDGSATGSGRMEIPYSISADGDIYGCNIDLKAGTELEISGGSFTGRVATSPTSFDWIRVIKCDGTSGNRVKLTINNGSFYCKSQAGIVSATYADVTVEGGNFVTEGKYGRSFRIRAGGNFTIKGGSFSTLTSIVQYSSATGTKMTIDGGKFVVKPDAVDGEKRIFNIAYAGGLDINGGCFATPDDVDIFSGSKLSSATVSLKGGKYTSDCSAVVAATPGYEWKTMGSPDSSTIPGYTLKYEVAAK